jgi:hypothetical protein
MEDSHLGVSADRLPAWYVFGAKGAGSASPPRRGKVCPKASAETANQIIAEEDAEVNRAVSAGEFLTKTWGVAQG